MFKETSKKPKELQGALKTPLWIQSNHECPNSRIIEEGHGSTFELQKSKKMKVKVCLLGMPTEQSSLQLRRRYHLALHSFFFNYELCF